ncbi:MAG: Uncharacterized protein LiPW41_712 [Parcubacteria group bacterium LiPW_41]|nr:MAG: Uncharacterized protein LiPW41_712 [Parcubacteria group bacterium LiPW_41]
MQDRVPIKNVEGVVVDVKNPQVNYSWSVKHGIINLRHTRLNSIGRGSRIKFFVRGAVIFASFLFFGLVAHTSYTLYKAKDEARETGERIASNIKSSVNSLQSLDSADAKSGFRKNINEFKNLEMSFNGSGATKIMSALGSIIPVFNDVGTVLKSAALLNTNFFILADSLDTLKRNGFSYFQSDGDALIKTLQAIQDSVKNITTDAETIKNATNKLKSFSDSAELMDKNIADMYLSHSAELYRAESFLNSFITLLNSENEKHILLLFQNPSEIRPAGGFLGSYADVSFAKGQMIGMDVRDIYDPDGQLDIKVVPPKELQTVTEKWGARDANWFPDFKLSAENVIWFLEQSKIYSEKDVKFDMAIAINIEVVESLIELTGPIALPEYNLTISKENFLKEVQREVEAGNDKKTNGQPKTILKKLAPILIERLKTLNDSQKEMLIANLDAHAEQKDIMVYAKDPSIQSFVHTYNLDGSLYDIPSNFFGSYLSVINTNVAGGKTDAFVSQAIEATIHIDTSGSLLSDVSITRKHSGGDQRDPWWNVDNKNYIQIYTNPGSSLVSLTGNSVKKIKSSFDYSASDFIKRDELKKIEDTKVFLTEWNAWVFSAFQKTGFGSWFFVSPKESRTISFRYHTDNGIGSGPKEGAIYEFYYDKQSGVSNSLAVSVNAPIGFMWKETNTPVLTYQVDDAKGFEKFSGTLIRSSR